VTPGGNTLPRFEIDVELDISWAPRIFPVPGWNPWTETVLLVDDPPEASQRVALKALPFAPWDEFTKGVPVPNVYQGQLAGAAIRWHGFTADEPAFDRRTIRITNLRGNASLLASRTLPAPVIAGVKMRRLDGPEVPITNSRLQVGAAQAALLFGTRDLRAFEQCRSVERTLAGTLRFSELIPGAFQTRTVGRFVSANTAPPPVAQPGPGVVYASESGFYNPRFPPDNGLNRAGLADFGSRLRAVFEGVPPGVTLWVDPVSSGGATVARLTTNEAVPFAAVMPPAAGAGLAPVPLSGRSGAAVWEILNSNPAALETVEFNVYASFTADAAAGQPGLGTVTVRGGFAPIVTDPDPSERVPIPRFTGGSAASQLFIINTCTGPPPLISFATLNAASFASGVPLAVEAIASGFAPGGLASSTLAAAAVPLPTRLGTTSVELSQGPLRLLAPLFFVSPGQINYLLPPLLQIGPATVTVLNLDTPVARGEIQIRAVAPGLFSANANGRGVAAALALLVDAAGNQTFLPVFAGPPATLVPVPIDLGSATQQVILMLFGTGLRGRSVLSAVRVRMGGADAEVLYAGAQGGFAGLDQVNVGIPRSLRGRGEVLVEVTVDGVGANQVTVAIR